MGSIGPSGVPGQAVTVAVEPAGLNCTNAGVALTSISGTNYVCNGAPATGAMFTGLVMTLPTAAAPTGVKEGAVSGVSTAVTLGFSGAFTLSPNRPLTITDFSVRVSAATLHSRTIDLQYLSGSSAFTAAECTLGVDETDCSTTGSQPIPALSKIWFLISNGAAGTENAADMIFSWTAQ